MALDYSIELKPLSSTFEAIALRKLLSQRFQLQLSSKTKIAFDEWVSVSVFQGDYRQTGEISVSIRINKFDWDKAIIKMLKSLRTFFNLLRKKQL